MKIILFILKELLVIGATMLLTSFVGWSKFHLIVIYLLLSNNMEGSDS